MNVKYFAYGRVFFFILWGLKYTAFRFDKFGSYIKMLKRSSRSVRRQRLTVTGRWLSGARGHGAGGMKNPCNLYPFWNAFYYHYILCVHRRRRERAGNSICRNVFSLSLCRLKLYHQNVSHSFIYLFLQIDHLWNDNIPRRAFSIGATGKTALKTCLFFFTPCYTIATRIMWALKGAANRQYNVIYYSDVWCFIGVQKSYGFARS